MAIEQRNYSSVSAVIQNAINAFNTIEQTLSAMGAKTTSNGVISNTQNYLSASELNTIISTQLQLKPTQSINLTSASGSLVNNNGVSVYSSYTIAPVVLGTSSTATTENTLLSAGNASVSGTTSYYPITLSALSTTVPVTTAGWFTGTSVETSVSFNMEAAKFSFNPSSGTVTCTQAGYVTNSGSSTIAPVQTATLTVGSGITSLTGDIFEAENPSTNLSNYYAITATPNHSLSGFRAGNLSSISGVTAGTDTALTKYVIKSVVTGGGVGDSRVITPADTVSITKGYLDANKTVTVSTTGAETTNLANYLLTGKKAWDGNNTLVTGNINTFNSSSTINLNDQTNAITISNGNIIVNGVVTPTGYHNGTKISGSLPIAEGTVSADSPVCTVYSGSSSVSNILESSAPSGSYYRVDLTPKATKTQGIIESGEVTGNTESYYIQRQSGVTVSGGALSKGNGSVSFDTYDSDVFKTSEPSGSKYTINVNGSGSVIMSAVTEEHNKGYYDAASSHTVINGTSSGGYSSNVQTKKLYVSQGSAGSLSTSLNSHTITAEAGDWLNGVQTTTTGHDTLSISDQVPASGTTYYKIKSTARVTPSLSGTSVGFIKSFPSGSAAEYTKYYYIPQATFEYKHDSTSGADFIQCKTAGYYPTGVLHIVDTSGDNTDDIDYADVIATLTSSIVSTGSSVPSGDYEIIIAKDGTTNPGYISGSNGTLSLNTKYYIHKGSVSSTASITSNTVESNYGAMLKSSASGLRAGYFTLTPKAAASSSITLDPGYVPSKGSEGSTGTVNGTIVYIDAGTATVSGGGLTAGSGVATFNATTIKRDTNNDLTSTDVLSATAPETGPYYEINISGSGSVSRDAVALTVQEGFIKANASVANAIQSATVSSGTATNKKYVVVSSLTNNATLPANTDATNVSHETYLKVSAGYYPRDRYIKAVTTKGAVSPTISTITSSQIGPSGTDRGTYTKTATLTASLNISVATPGYVASDNNSITPKTLEQLSKNSVNINITKGALSGAALGITSNSSSASKSGDSAKLTTSSATHVKVEATRDTLTVAEGYVTSSDRAAALTSVASTYAYIPAMVNPSTEISVSGSKSGTIGSITTFNSTTGAVLTAGSKSGTISVPVDGTADKTNFKDNYIIGKITVSASGTGSATATIAADASGTNVDNAVAQLYKCLLGQDYTTV